MAEFVGDDSIMALYGHVKKQADNEEYMQEMYMFKAIMSAGLKLYHVNKSNFNQLVSPMLIYAFNNKNILYRTNAITIFPNMLENSMDSLIRDVMVGSTNTKLTVEARGLGGVKMRLNKDNYDSVIDGFEIQL